MRMFNFTNAGNRVLSMANGQTVVTCAKSNLQIVEPGNLRLYLRAFGNGCWTALRQIGRSLFSGQAGMRDQKYCDAQIWLSLQSGRANRHLGNGSFEGDFAGSNLHLIALPASVDPETTATGMSLRTKPVTGWRFATLVMR